MFITNARIAVYEFDPATTVSERPPNIIYIRSKMDVGTKNKVQDHALKMTTGKTDDAEIHIGAYQTALLTHNVLAWEGPDFHGVPCTPQQMQMLDPDEPLVVKVLEEIGRRNRPQESPNPKSPGANGSTRHGAPDSTASENNLLVIENTTSGSPSATTGRPRK